MGFRVAADVSYNWVTMDCVTTIDSSTGGRAQGKGIMVGDSILC